MILIGATGRNVGKTECACSLIRRFSTMGPIVGVKVTTIAERTGECPRGGAGCGVCTSLKRDWLVTEETGGTEAGGTEAGGTGNKDTRRMLAAGAVRVYWLRCLKTALAGGLEDLLRTIGPGARIVCESNSLRLVGAPDLFIMVKDPASDKCKATAEAVRAMADREVRFDGKRFEPSLDDLVLVRGRWRFRERATAIVLAGGRSERMGRDKSLLPAGGAMLAEDWGISRKSNGIGRDASASEFDLVAPPRAPTLLEHVVRQLRPHFDEVLIGSNDAQKHGVEGARVVADRVAGQGPFMAVASCLAASRSDLNFVTACDTPELDLEHVQELLLSAKGRDAVVPVGADGRYEPLHAIYRKSLLPVADRLLAAGRRRIVEAYPELNVLFLPVPEGSAGWPKNLNTPEEYEEYVRRAGLRPRKDPS